MVENSLPQYEPPSVLTYTDKEILEELGPARTFTSGDHQNRTGPADPGIKS